MQNLWGPLWIGAGDIHRPGSRPQGPHCPSTLDPRVIHSLSTAASTDLIAYYPQLFPQAVGGPRRVPTASIGPAGPRRAHARPSPRGAHRRTTATPRQPAPVLIPRLCRVIPGAGLAAGRWQARTPSAPRQPIFFSRSSPASTRGRSSHSSWDPLPCFSDRARSHDHGHVLRRFYRGHGNAGRTRATVEVFVSDRPSTETRVAEPGSGPAMELKAASATGGLRARQTCGQPTKALPPSTWNTPGTRGWNQGGNPRVESEQARSRNQSGLVAGIRAGRRLEPAWRPASGSGLAGL